MSDVLASKSGAPKACKTLRTVRNPRVELGLCLYGLCGRLTTYLEEEQRDLGHRGLTHEDNSLHSHKKHIDLKPIGASLPRGDSPIVWYAELSSV